MDFIDTLAEKAIKATRNPPEIARQYVETVRERIHVEFDSLVDKLY